MNIGVVSDTHGNLKTTERAVEILRQADVEVVLHCGDICGSQVVAMFEDWPTHFVTGNCDDPLEMEQAVKAAGQNWHGLFGDLTIGPRTIALLHSHEPQRLERVIDSGIYDLVCYGHTHIKEQHQVKETLVLNPGALHRANPHTLAIVNLDTLQADYLIVD